MLSLYSFPNQLLRGNICLSMVKFCTVSASSLSEMWIFFLVSSLQSIYRRIFRSLLLIQELKRLCSSGEVLPSYWQYAQIFPLLQGRSHSCSFRALFTWQTIHFRGVSLISWIYSDPTYICCHVFWRSKIVCLEQAHICFSVTCFGLDGSGLVTRLTNVMCSLSA